MTPHTIAAQTHGRYLIDIPAGGGPFPLLVGFHGYGESAAEMLEALLQIRGQRPWLAVSIQALNRFYNRSNSSIVASWMTREDRELAIADNLAYVSAVVNEVRTTYPASEQLVYVGFSQGVAMAYRVAAFGPAARGVIVLAGDVPPDVAPRAAALPRILIGRGTSDEWYTESKALGDRAVFDQAGACVESYVFDGGHDWDPRFVARAGVWLDALGET